MQSDPLQDIRAYGRWTTVGGQVFVSYADGGSLHDAQRREWLEQLSASTAAHYISGCGPSFMLSSLDRELMHRVLSDKGMTYTVVTDNPLGRGMATSASWAGIEARVHLWQDLRKATSDLRLAAPLEDQVYGAMRQLRLEVTSKLTLLQRSAERQGEASGELASVVYDPPAEVAHPNSDIVALEPSANGDKESHPAPKSLGTYARRRSS